MDKRRRAMQIYGKNLTIPSWVVRYSIDWLNWKNELNRKYYMGKKVIKLTESELKEMIVDAVKQVLNEGIKVRYGKYI